MGNILAGIRDQWGQLAPTKRLALVVIVLGVLGTLGLWTFLGSQVPYEVAFDHVKSADASTVVDKLRELQIPYQMTGELDGTTTIRVPVSQVDEARVRVAGAGLLQGSSVGYEIFNQPSFGLSDFIQQVDYQRALEGELARSISQIDSVDTVRVHLAIPQPSLFVSQQRDPSAAVMVGLKSGRQMDRTQAKAIVDLVVGAVQGMKPEQVVLLDTQGQLLHQTTTPNGTNLGAIDDQYAAQKSMEQDVETRLQDMLDRVVGPGHSSVQVALALDWTQGDVTNDTYTPNGAQPAIQSSQDVHDVQPAGANAIGPAGVVSNVPTYQQIAPTVQVTSTLTTTVGTTEHTESTRTYQVSHVVDKTQKSPGTIQRLSVAIAVDQAAANPAVVNQITQMAQAAVGYDGKRGDTVSVVAVPMKPDLSASLASSSSPSPPPSPTVEYARLTALVGGPVLAILVLAYVLLRRRGRRPSVLPRSSGPPMLQASITSLPASSALVDPRSLPIAPAARHAYIREQLTGLAEKHPALVASVLQAWVNEDGGEHS